MAALTMGVDVGQVSDPTALVVADPDGPAGNPATRYLVRHLERLPLGTDYPVVALRIAQVAVGACSQAHEVTGVGRRVVVYLDQTGVGRPVADLVRRTVGGIPRVALVAVTITGGDQIQPRRPGELSVAKQALVSRAQVLAQHGRIKLPATAEARVLADELRSFDLTITEGGHFRAGARAGAHDDLVVALALAVLDPNAGRPKTYFRAS